MFWEWFSAKQGTEDEYHGWRAFRKRSGIWPFYSMLTTIVVMPFCFAAGLYGLTEVLKAANGQLILIYPGLFAAVAVPAFLWFAFRRFANRMDVQRAERHHKESLPPDRLERLIE